MIHLLIKIIWLYLIASHVISFIRDIYEVLNLVLKWIRNKFNESFVPTKKNILSLIAEYMTYNLYRNISLQILLLCIICIYI